MSEDSKYISPLPDIPPVEVLVFKTNLNSPADVNRVAVELKAAAHVLRWNVDLEDVDRVLRIETSAPEPHEIVNVLAAAGYECEELQD
jgi:hypothetical protein